MLENLNAVFIDTETGGLETCCSLLQVGAVFIREGKVVMEKEINCRPESTPYIVTAKALEINGINLAEHDKTANSYGVVAEKLSHWIVGTYPRDRFEDTRPFLGGHNIQFDTGFLKAHLFHGDAFGKLFHHRMIDTCSIARMLVDAGKIPPEFHSSDGMIEWFKIPIRGQRHSALTDAWIAWDLYQAMVKAVA